MSVKYNLLTKHSNSAEVLVLGNSHTFFGIQPKYLSEKAINISNKSRKLETDYFILKHHIKKLKALKRVMIPISYYTLFTNDISEQEKRLYYNFYKLKEYDQQLLKNSLLINAPFRELIDDLIFNRFEKIEHSLGWRANSGTYHFNEKEILERVGDVNGRVNNSVEIAYNLKILKKIIDLCENMEVDLVLILPPYHPDFYRYSKGRYERKIEDALSTLDLKETIIINSKTLGIKSEEYFENIDHLNSNGAKVLTRKIDSILMNFKKCSPEL
ncbi:MAG: hypothetical protein HRT67_02600 [Flavobacteriaceae bacterium]|nr:hypothetical protein [Flavobacteriaceae bacterium]